MKSGVFNIPSELCYVTLCRPLSSIFKHQCRYATKWL